MSYQTKRTKVNHWLRSNVTLCNRRNGSDRTRTIKQDNIPTQQYSPASITQDNATLWRPDTSRERGQLASTTQNAQHLRQDFQHGGSNVHQPNRNSQQTQKGNVIVLVKIDSNYINAELMKSKPKEAMIQAYLNLWKQLNKNSATKNAHAWQWSIQ